MCNKIDICFICLERSNNLVLITSQDTNATSFEDKLKYFIPGLELKSNIPKYICAKCESDLSRSYEFKQKCLQNITTYEKYAQQITAVDGSYFLSDFIHRKFVKEEAEIFDEKNYDTNISQLKNEIEEIIIKEESSEKVINDGLELLLHDVKQENSESDVSDIKTENIIENIEIPFSTENENDLKQDDKNLYRCKICDESFNCRQSFERHQLTHTNKKKYSCDICKKSFRQLQPFKDHCTIHTGEKSYICEFCNKSFRHKQNFKRHKMLHTNEKPYTCDVCVKSFQQLHILKRHKLIHTGEKPFTCEVCNKSFRELKDLKDHKLIHTGEKPFTCDVCKKSFRILSTLKIHKYQHTGEKPHTCEVCNQSFRRLQVLKDHKLIHTGEKPFTCEVCNKSFRLLRVLKRHKLVHIDKKLRKETLQLIDI